jgi:exonuclease SbcC
MKILRLTLCNLASLAGEQTLDYRAEPLASAGLTAITGPTGSGKSTILDAMCLALFGQVPRLRSASKGQDGRVPDGLDNESLTMHDPRTLLRRGAAEGYAEVEFVGQDGRIYSANWQVRRARNKSTGNLLAATRVLKDLTSGQTLTNQVRECDAQISLLIGLNFEQFTRAVMLAQSEFGAFLKATDVERAQLLERLLETDIYRRLGEFAFEKRKKYQETYQQLKNKIGDLIPLEPDARVALESSLSILSQNKNDLESRRTYLLASRDWYRKKTQLNTQLLESTETARQVDTHLLSLAPHILKIQQLEQLSVIRPVIAQQQTLTQRISQLKKDFSEQKINLETTKKQLMIHQAEHVDVENNLIQAQKEQVESRPKVTLAQGLEQDLSRLSVENTRLLEQLDAQKNQCTNTQNELDQNLTQQYDLTRQLQLISEQLKQTENLSALDEQWSAHLERMREAEKIHQALNQLGQTLPQLQSNALKATAQLQQTNQLLEVHRKTHGSDVEKNVQLVSLKQQHATSRQADLDLRTLSQKYHDYLHTWSIIVELQAKQAAHSNRADQLEKIKLDAQKHVQTAELELATLLKVLNQQRLLRTKNVESLRSQLQPDQACPVCGSKEHPFSVATHLLEAMESDDEQQEKSAREKLTNAQKQHHEVETELKFLNKTVNDQNVELNRHSADEKSKKHALKQIPFADELRLHASEERSEWLAQRITLTNQVEHVLKERITSLEMLLSSEVELIQNAEQARFKYAENQQKVEATLSNQLQLTQRLEQAEQYFLSSLDVKLQQDWRVDMGNTIAHLLVVMTERLAQKSAQKNLHELLVKTQYSYQLLIQTNTQEVAKQKELDDHQKLLSKELLVKQTQLKELLNAASDSLKQPIQNAFTWQTQLETRTTQAQQAVSSAQVQLNLMDKQIQKLMTTSEHIKQQLSSDENEQIVVTNKITDWHQNHPTLSNDAFNALLAVTTIEEKQLKQDVEQAQHRQIEAKARLVEHQKQVEQHEQNQPVFLTNNSPENLLAEFDLVSRIEENAQQFDLVQQEWMLLQFQLKQDDECKTKSTSLQVELQKAEVEYHRIDRMASPIASKDGKVFQKIAQAYFLDRLLEDTNQQLGQLTQRYQLVRAADSLGLLVIDSDMGDERRSVHSLSGGESCFVYLALALGLASMASGRLRIESLFIDEGFGTLDPESLQVVMDALDRLQSQGRKVTVITHVQEMHERIPTQIQVQKMGNGQSKLTVV